MSIKQLHDILRTRIKRKTKIRTRAYELYEQRAREDGSELADWVQAGDDVLNSGENLKAV